MTSSAFVPMLPVEPNTATFFVAAGIGPIRVEKLRTANHLNRCTLPLLSTIMTTVPTNQARDF